MSVHSNIETTYECHGKDYRALYGKVSKSRWFKEAYDGRSVGEAMRKE